MTSEFVHTLFMVSIRARTFTLLLPIPCAKAISKTITQHVARHGHKNLFAIDFFCQLRLRRMARRLPIYEIERDIVARLKTGRRLILSAPTGSGKSTQVPQMLLKHGLLGNGQVVILQPRRLATRLLAARVAQELGVELGREVGYQVRFENCVSDATRIKFETEGILLRQLIRDPALRGIQAII